MEKQVIDRMLYCLRKGIFLLGFACVAFMLSFCDSDTIDIEGTWEKETGFRVDEMTGAVNRVYFPYYLSNSEVERHFEVYEQGVVKFYRKKCTLVKNEESDCTLSYEPLNDLKYSVEGNTYASWNDNSRFEGYVDLKGDRLIWTTVSDSLLNQTFIRTKKEEIFSNLATGI